MIFPLTFGVTSVAFEEKKTDINTLLKTFSISNVFLLYSMNNVMYLIYIYIISAYLLIIFFYV